MKLYTCTDHDAHYPVGCASIVLAENEEKARIALDFELIRFGLDPNKPYTLEEVPLDVPAAIVLVTGNY